MLFGILFFLYLTSIVSSFIIAVREVQRPILALTWIVLSLLVPIIGPSVYFLLSRRQIRRYSNMSAKKANSSAEGLDKTVSTTAEDTVNISTEKPEKTVSPFNDKTSSSLSLEKNSAKILAEWCSRMLERPPLPSRVAVLKNGLAKYRVLLKALRSAQHCIDMEYYIYRDDEIGRTVTKVLMDKAAHGVYVRLLRDGLGSRKLPQSILQAMLNSGVNIRTVHPLSSWLSPMLTHRDHNKIVTIDGQTGFIGGMNIGDEYTGRSKKTGLWRDTHLQIAGKGVEYLQQVFDSIWEIGVPHRRKSQTNRAFKPLKAPARSAGTGKTLRDNTLLIEAAEELAVPTEQLSAAQETSDKQEISPWQRTWVQTVDSGPDSDAEHVRDLFFLCATEATHTLDIITPYFAPDTDIVTALKTAAARAVKVRLVVPLKPDHKIIGWAARTFYADLLLAGIDMYLYKKGILHAKSIIVDKETCVVGAANYDLLSFRNNYESCEVIYGRQFADLLQSQFEADIADSVRLTLDQVEGESAWAKIRNKGARLLAPLL